MSVPTDEVALVILAAVNAEQKHPLGGTSGRRTFSELTQQLMDRHGWRNLDFMAGWGMITTEQLAEVTPIEGNYYPRLTEAGREYISKQHVVIYEAAHRGILLAGRDWLFIFMMGAILVRFAMIVWQAR